MINIASVIQKTAWFYAERMQTLAKQQLNDKTFKYTKGAAFL